MQLLNIQNTCLYPNTVTVMREQWQIYALSRINTNESMLNTNKRTNDAIAVKIPHRQLVVYVAK